MIYYCETNLIAILVALALFLHGRKTSARNETSHIVMNYMLSLLIIISVCDIAAYLSRGKSYWGSMVFNGVYFLAMALGTYTWFVFILVKLGYSTQLKKTLLVTGLPMALLCIAIMLNPINNLFFLVDEELVYHRGSGIILTWIVEWGYMAAAILFNVLAILREKRSHRKSEYYGYLIFAVPIAVAAVSQMLFYGTTTIQVGFMLSMLLVYLNQQHYQVQRDDLTGLNNKNAFLIYRDAILTRSDAVNLTVFMVDADKFKLINDAYGHLKGDKALREIAQALLESAADFSPSRLSLYRYGGDEFVLLGSNLTSEQIAQFPATIQSNIAAMNAANQNAGESYTLGVSVGHATAPCASLADFDSLMKQADEHMYQIKQAKMVQR